VQRVAIIDDEALARKGMRRLLSRHHSLKIVGEADSTETALKMISMERPDVIFLDIEMPGSSGFDMLSRLDRIPKVVIVSAHAEHAIHAFDVQAIDYLLKPVTPARFAQAIQRIESGNPSADSTTLKAPYSTEDRICLRTPQRTVIAPINSIPALQADGDFTRFFFKDSPPLMICHPLGEYEATLPSPPFLRIDRSHIVNLDLMIRIDRRSRDEASLILEGIPEGIPLARTSQQRLKTYLG
jgi:two-component system LytT family response regulator